MNREMLMLVDAISREKSVEREVVFGAVEAAHDRPANARTEVGRLNARQLADGFAQRVGLGFVEPLAGKYFHRARQVLRGAGQRVGMDLNRVQVDRLVRVELGLVVVGQCRQGQGERQGQKQREAAQSGLRPMTAGHGFG